MGEKLARSSVNSYLSYASDSNITKLENLQTNYINNLVTVSSKLNDLDFSSWDDPISTLTFSRCNDLKNSYYSTISKNIEKTTTSSLEKLIKAVKKLNVICNSYITWDEKSYTFPSLNEEDKEKYDNDNSSEMTESAREAVSAYKQNLRTKETNLITYSDKIREILTHITEIEFDKYGTSTEDLFDYSVSTGEEVVIPDVTYTETPHSDTTPRDETNPPEGDGTYLVAAPNSRSDARIRANNQTITIMGYICNRFGLLQEQRTLEDMMPFFNEYNIGCKFTFYGSQYYNNGWSWGYQCNHNYGTYTYVGKAKINRFGLGWDDNKEYPIFQDEKGRYFTIVTEDVMWSTTCGDGYRVQEIHPKNNKHKFQQQAYFNDEYTTTVNSSTSSSDYDRAVSAHQNIVVQDGDRTRRFVYDVGTGRYYETDENGYYTTYNNKKWYSDPRQAK